MRKIPTLYVRQEAEKGRRSLVTSEVNPACAWVFQKDWVAHRKWDGACCCVRNGELWKRYDAKQGKTPPAGFVPCGEPDPHTGHHPGWLPVDPANPADRWFVEGWENSKLQVEFHGDGTYELIGPKVQGNIEQVEKHVLIRHDNTLYTPPTLYFIELKDWLSRQDIEGLVIYEKDGDRMAKIKLSDFGIDRLATRKNKHGPPPL